MRGNQQWRIEKIENAGDKGLENLKHMLRECETKEEISIEEFLKEDGGSRETMRKIIKARERKEEKREEERVSGEGTG